jgi:hypothetical protein
MLIKPTLYHVANKSFSLKRLEKKLCGVKRSKLQNADDIVMMVKTYASPSSSADLKDVQNYAEKGSDGQAVYTRSRLLQADTLGFM